jgi:hypothetical protein
MTLGHMPSIWEPVAINLAILLYLAGMVWIATRKLRKRPGSKK